MSTITHEQPAPIANTSRPVWELVIEDVETFNPVSGRAKEVKSQLLADMVARDALGRERYGTPLQTHNGRDHLRDAYEEALDLVVYLRASMIEDPRVNPAAYSSAFELVWKVLSMIKDRAGKAQ